MANKKRLPNERPQKMADSQPRFKLQKKDLWMRRFGYIIMIIIAIGIIVWALRVFI